MTSSRSSNAPRRRMGAPAQQGQHAGLQHRSPRRPVAMVEAGPPRLILRWRAGRLCASAAARSSWSFRRGNALLEIFQAERQLIGIELLRPSAEAMTLQRHNDRPQPVAFRNVLCPFGDQQRPQHFGSAGRLSASGVTSLICHSAPCAKSSRTTESNLSQAQAVACNAPDLDLPDARPIEPLDQCRELRWRQPHDTVLDLRPAEAPSSSRLVNRQSPVPSTGSASPGRRAWRGTQRSRRNRDRRVDAPSPPPPIRPCPCGSPPAWSQSAPGCRPVSRSPRPQRMENRPQRALFDSSAYRHTNAAGQSDLDRADALVAAPTRSAGNSGPSTPPAPSVIMIGTRSGSGEAALPMQHVARLHAAACRAELRLIPCRRAISVTFAPGTIISATSRAFSSLPHASPFRTG